MLARKTRLRRTQLIIWEFSTLNQSFASQWGPKTTTRWRNWRAQIQKRNSTALTKSKDTVLGFKMSRNVSQWCAPTQSTTVPDITTIFMWMTCPTTWHHTNYSPKRCIVTPNFTYSQARTEETSHQASRTQRLAQRPTVEDMGKYKMNLILKRNKETPSLTHSTQMSSTERVLESASEG